MRAFATLVALVSVVVPAGAQNLYNKDGVQMSATARLIEPEAATCRIREARHTPEQYEKLKPNEGEPLDVWRVEVVVANYSGKVLDRLSAHLNVESSWPPCDHWDGPESHYGKSVVWTGPLMTISDVGSVQPGEERREVEFVLAWHEDDPVLGRWDIDYDFAAASPAAGDRGAPDVSGRPGAPSASRPAATDRPNLLDHMRGASRREPQAAAQPSRQPGETFRDTLRSGGSGPEMVVVPAGSFRMGCVSGVGCRDDEYPVHQVTIPRAFAVGKYEVTFAEWDACVSAGGCDRRPLDEAGDSQGRHPIYVSWGHAQEYVRWLSSETGSEYRLLSESEWEYAARAGTSTAYHFGNDESALCRYGNHADRSYEFAGPNALCSDGFGTESAPVGSFGANGFGLHDMYGNTAEWVQDCWNDSYNGAPSNGAAWQQGNCSRRVVRGGSWTSVPRGLRSAFRDWFPSHDGNYLGFRVARTLTP